MRAEFRKQNHSGALPRFGASPAFYLSLFGEAFGCRDILTAARRASALGLSSLQLEVFRADALGEWSPAFLSELGRVFRGEGLEAGQFVAHFMLADFAGADAIRARALRPAFPRVAELAAACAEFGAPGVLTVPVPAFEAAPLGGPAFDSVRASFVEYLRDLVEEARSRRLRLALELMPHSIVGGIEGFLRLRSEPGLGELAYNLDVGHAWARRERIELAPAQLGGAIAGVHLGDNDARENRKLRPGAGSIDWAATLGALLASGYDGTLDLEISCPADSVDSEYALGKRYLEDVLRGIPPRKAVNGPE